MMIPPIVSVDDHVIEPPDLWQRWLPERHRERGPRVVRAPYEMVPAGRQPFRRCASSDTDTDFWEYDGESIGIQLVMAAAGLDDDTIADLPIKFEEMRPGCFEIGPRLADMDTNGVERSLCFPTYPRFCGQTFLDANDKELALACVQAYNDWMTQEWAADSGGRMIPLCIIPLWDAELAGQEVRRNAARGVRAVTFSELPQMLGLPSLYNADRYWDPFLQACDETSTVICVHIGSASTSYRSSEDAPSLTGFSLTSMNSILSLTDWLVSGALVWFPNLKIAFSESQVGWMPYQIQRIDDSWHQNRARPLGRGGLETLTDPPSSLVHGHIYGCVVRDDVGIAMRGGPLGVEQLTFETDYPHTDSTWPNTAAYAEKAFADYSDTEIELVVRKNAIHLFELPETLPGT